MEQSLADKLARGREAFEQQTWGAAHNLLSSVSEQSPLSAADQEKLAISAHLIGRDTEGAELWARAHREYLSAGQAADAVRCAFWLALFAIMIDEDAARSSGWLARAQRILDDGKLECVERGYLFLPVALRKMYEGEPASALEAFENAVHWGDQFRDANLMTLGRLGQGQALLRLGRVAEGVDLMDEVMVAVTAGDVSPIAVGIAYCAVIDGCQQIFDLRRAQTWTDALSRWCASQQDLVPYRRQCLVNRAEIMRLHGAWPEAIEEAQRARNLVSQVPDRLGSGSAYYQEAEVYRLRGEFVKAEEAYRLASSLGRSPQPGLARLRLMQGQADMAVAAIERELSEPQDQRQQALLLEAYAEVLLARGEVVKARQIADDLAVLAGAFDSPLLTAMAYKTQGSVQLADRDARAALPALRSAWKAWYELEAPYEAARVRVLIGQACSSLADVDGAELELGAARQIFRQLGAAPDLRALDALRRAPSRVAVSGLTEREVEVLRLIASGKTNRTIAEDLVISEKTVARHVSNILSKLGLASRAAATAFAYEHGIL